MTVEISLRDTMLCVHRLNTRTYITSIVWVHVISFTHMTSCVTIWELKKTGIPISEVLMLAGRYPSINFTLYPFTVSDSKVGTVKSSFQGFSFFL